MRTALTLIAAGVAISSTAQFEIGPGARFTWVDAPSEFKLGYSLHVSQSLDDRWRLNLEGYWTPWEDVNYLVDFSSAFGRGPTFETHYDYTNWGLNLDLERDMGRRWFVSGGLGYSSYHTARTKTETDGSTSEISVSEWDDRLLALNLGFGKRWRLGPGDLRAAISAGVVGYNFDNDNNHVPAFETYGFSLSYQFRFGKKK